MTGKQVSDFRTRFIELIESSPKSRSVIAQEFGVAKQTISAWITGQSSPRLPVATALAEYFDVNLDWLLGFDVPKHIEKKDPEQFALNLQRFNDAQNQKPRTIEAQLLARGVDNMPAEQREQALNIMKTVFIQYKEYFEKGEHDDDNP